MTVIIVVVLIIYAGLIATQFRFGKVWVNPIFFLLLYYLFNYPVRAFLLLYYPEIFNNRYSFTDEEILASLRDWATNEGIFLSPEGAAATAAYDHLLKTGFLKPEDRVVLFNTGAGLKYTDVTAEAAGIQRPS